MTKSQISEIGIRVKELRKIKKVTQGQLAEYVGLTTSAIGRMEIGRSLPSIEVFAAMCKYFNISADKLLFGEEYTSALAEDEAAKYETKDEFLKKYVESLERENALLREREKK